MVCGLQVARGFAMLQQTAHSAVCNYQTNGSN